MRAIDLVTTVVAIRDAVAPLHRADVTAAVVTAHRVVGATLVRSRPQRGLLYVPRILEAYLDVVRCGRIFR